jgi:hypothetical protein
MFVLRIFEDLFNGPLLDDLSMQHDHDMSTHQADDTEIVRDK